MPEEVKLKPCPFCGSQRLDIFYAGDGYYMDCAHCRARGPFSTVERVGMECPDRFFAAAEKEAESAWNRRTPEPGTSVIRWTRYDGKAEMLPGQQKSVLLRLSGGDNTRLSYWFGTSYMWHLEDGSVSQIRVGDLWAYLPELPEEVE